MDSVLILGGAGLVGSQISRQIAENFHPKRIFIASLFEHESVELVRVLRKEFPETQFEPVWGNIFVRTSVKDWPKERILKDPKQRALLINDIIGELTDEVYNNNFLVKLILDTKPEVLVDSVNTATGISYQDIYTTAIEIQNSFKSNEDVKMIEERVETALSSLEIPQLVRHVQMVSRATSEVKTKIYVKVGTTGTGGMGLNIPYTHSEDKPSRKLMSKNAVAFAHTGLLFLMARTPGMPIVKEVKPAAMIGYKQVAIKTIRKKGGKEKQEVYEGKEVPIISGMLPLSLSFDDFVVKDKLTLPVIDTGENGVFTRGEFEAITALGQMEFVTPEEVARIVVLEIKGVNTGKDLISAVDGSVMDPSYKAGLLRAPALKEVVELEKKQQKYSIALGQLGPPELSKLLYEAHLLYLVYRTIENVVKNSPEEISQALTKKVMEDAEFRDTAISIGVPIFLPDGKRMIRGPKINIPEIPGKREVEITQENIDMWAKKGWIDLRPQNIKVWQARFGKMIKSRESIVSEGSSAFVITSYPYDEIVIGEVVAWIFSNEMGGYRIIYGAT
jgi:hypothetical protein